jgi:hypothetical protein
MKLRGRVCASLVRPLRLGGNGAGSCDCRGLDCLGPFPCLDVPGDNPSLGSRDWYRRDSLGTSRRRIRHCKRRCRPKGGPISVLLDKLNMKACAVVEPYVFVTVECTVAVLVGLIVTLYV